MNRIETNRAQHTSAPEPSSTEPIVRVAVPLPRRNATDQEIARAYLYALGYSDADITALNQWLGTDYVRDGAEAFRKQGARARIQVSKSYPRGMIVLSPNKRDYDILRGFAESRGIGGAPAVPSGAIAAPQPRGGAQPSPGATHAEKPKGGEGLDSFCEGMIMGDFSDNPTWSKLAGQLVTGVIPVVGQVADARDTAAAVYDIYEGKQGGWVNLGLTLVAWVPLVGDAVKAGTRTTKQLCEEAAKEGAERLAQRLAEQEEKEATRAAKEAAAVAGEEPKGLFYKPTTEGTPRLAAGTGETDIYGNILYSTHGTAKEQIEVLHHEKVHAFLSPRLNVLREFRADVAWTAYKKSSFCQYLEEALAETYAQLRVNGIDGLGEGIVFPITHGYVKLSPVIHEGAIGVVTVGRTIYRVYVFTGQRMDQGGGEQ